MLQVAVRKRRAAYLSMDRARSTAHNLTRHGVRKRRAAYLSMDRARSTAHNLTGHGGGRLHAAFLPGRALCAAV